MKLEVRSETSTCRKCGRWYPDQRDEKQYADCTSLSVNEETIHAGELTEEDDGFGLL